MLSAAGSLGQRPAVRLVPLRNALRANTAPPVGRRGARTAFRVMASATVGLPSGAAPEEPAGGPLSAKPARRRRGEWGLDDSPPLVSNVR